MGLRDYARFFRDEEEEAQDVKLANSRKILDWCSQEYHEVFDGWLEDEASKPFEISKDHMEMVKAAVRANTFKEVRKHILSIRKNAEAAVRTAREEM